MSVIEREQHSGRFKVVHSGCGAAVQVMLAKGETVKAESDALVVKSKDVSLRSRLDGGLLWSMLRSMLTNETLYFQTLTASGEDSNYCLFAASSLGDITLLDVAEGPMCMTQGSFLVADDTVEIVPQTQSSVGKAVFAGGLFIMRASGSGKLAVNGHGSLLEYRLGPGEVRSVDNGHVVAWSADMAYHIGLATPSLWSSVTSGEGMMCHFTGPGCVYVQTHKPDPMTQTQNTKAGTANAAPILFCCVIGVGLVMLFVAITLLAAYTSNSGYTTTR